MKKKTRKISISEDRYNQLINTESDYKLLSQLLVSTSYYNEQTHNISFKEKGILKVLEIANEELYKNIIEKNKENNYGNK